MPILHALHAFMLHYHPSIHPVLNQCRPRSLYIYPPKEMKLNSQIQTQTQTQMTHPTSPHKSASVKCKNQICDEGYLLSFCLPVGGRDANYKGR